MYTYLHSIASWEGGKLNTPSSFLIGWAEFVVVPQILTSNRELDMTNFERFDPKREFIQEDLK